MFFQIPIFGSQESACMIAGALNRAEADTKSPSHLIGSWCAKTLGNRSVPAFATFLPTALYKPGLLTSLTYSAVNRARWVAGFLEPNTRPENVGRLILRRLSIETSDSGSASLNDDQRRSDPPETNHRARLAADAVSNVRYITFILGPPGPEEKKQLIEHMAATSGKAKDEVWLELVQEILHDLAKHAPFDSESGLDKLLSLVNEAPVRVNDPAISYSYDREGKHPTIILESKNIMTSTGEVCNIDWSVNSAKDTIANALGYLLKTEWVRTIIAYEE